MEIAMFYKKFNINEFHIYESEFWVWSVRPSQVTIGSGVLSLKRECSTFSEVTEEEFSDLKNIIEVIENTLKKTFNYDIMNYLMLMMVDNHVHYHVIPRYKKTINFSDTIWKDSNWPGIPELNNVATDTTIVLEIRDAIKANIID